MKPFRPNAKQTQISFYEVPIDVLEDAEQLVAWAGISKAMNTLPTSFL
jgi:hypothetical protein